MTFLHDHAHDKKQVIDTLDYLFFVRPTFDIPARPSEKRILPFDRLGRRTLTSLRKYRRLEGGGRRAENHLLNPRLRCSSQFVLTATAQMSYCPSFLIGLSSMFEEPGIKHQSLSP